MAKGRLFIAVGILCFVLLVSSFGLAQVPQAQPTFLDRLWLALGANIYNGNPGNVGIGTLSPRAP